MDAEELADAIVRRIEDGQRRIAEEVAAQALTGREIMAIRQAQAPAKPQ